MANTAFGRSGRFCAREVLDVIDVGGQIGDFVTVGCGVHRRGAVIELGEGEHAVCHGGSQDGGGVFAVA